MKKIKTYIKKFKEAAPLILGIIYRNDKKAMFLGIFSNLLQSAFLIFQIIVKTEFFIRLQDYKGGGTWHLILFFALYGIIILIFHVLNGLANFFMNLVFNRFNTYMKNEIGVKASKLEPIYFEIPENLNNLNRAKTGVSDLLWFVFSPIVSACIYIPYMIFTSVYFFGKDASFALVIPVVFIPALVSNLLRAKYKFKLAEEEASATRAKDEYKSYIVEKSAKEMRSGGYFNYLNKKYLDNWNKAKKLRHKTNLQIMAIDILLSMLSMAGYGILLYAIITKSMNTVVEVAVIASVLTTLSEVTGLIREFIQNMIEPMADSAGNMSFAIDFFNEKEREEKAKVDHIDSVKISDLSFKYPSADNYSVKGVNLELKRDKLVAIVGENGSGKSTLLKLVLGLFEPTSGDIKYFRNDKEEKNIDILDRSSALFQDYNKYKLTLRENIEISDLYNIEDNKWKDALAHADIELNSNLFPNGGETIMSRDFDGVDLSGGQWQRLALARGIYRDRDLLVLDEPTAAIDPLEETALYNKISDIMKGKLGLLITHRIGSARLADEILVMDKGEIIERGTHDELMTARGMYWEMVGAQAVWYER
ncbi:MAG: ABC transporter ATP-binding protein [Firmicutes bacterium]|nr:ABC transporter ATP-binding protein [Bacillota bacterium]